MNVNEIQGLQRGDCVFWTDPDDGLCSRKVEVVGVALRGDEVVLHGASGEELHCLPGELSRAR
jgi:hypothetical protein